MGKFLFQLTGTIITLAIIGFIGYLVFTRLFQSAGDNECNEVVAVKEYSYKANISAAVSDLNIEHNICRNGKTGMNLSSKQTFYNLKGKTCHTAIRFFDEEGRPLVGKSARDEDGSFCIIGNLTPDDNECVNDQCVFVAYDQFDIPQDKETVHYLCDIRIFILNNNGERVELAHSNPSRFHLSH